MVNPTAGMTGDEKIKATFVSLVGAFCITVVGCIALCVVQSTVATRRLAEVAVEAGYEQQMVSGCYYPIWVKADCQCSGACKCSPEKCEVNNKLWPDPANESGVK